jgi:hypothetical protein
MGQDIGIHEPLPAGRRLSTGRRAWFNTRPRIAIGFRRHGGVAWRVKSNWNTLEHRGRQAVLYRISTARIRI